MNRLKGFTLIEVLVVVSVIGLLIALFLPAVQSARSAARRLQCTNHLKNIGVSIHNHVDARGKFPSGVGKLPADTSFLVQILPYLEQKPLYDSINVVDGVESDSNLTAFKLPPSLFICPSDVSRSSAQVEGAVNYAGNVGKSLAVGDGAFAKKPLSARDITDGLSQTGGVSEWITGPGIGNGVVEVTSKYRLKRVYSSSKDLESFARDCDLLTDVDPKYLYLSKGQFWLQGGVDTSLYNHILPPNRHSCAAPVSMNATTAGSYHGGVNLLTMDGSVRLVRDSINPRIWTALGTRAGGEIEAVID